MRSNTLRLGLSVFCVLVLSVRLQAQFAPDAIVAGRFLAPDGSLESNATIFLSHGKIRSVQPGVSQAQGTQVVRHENAVVFPGLIDVRSSLGTFGRMSETASAIDPAANAVDLVDRGHRDFARAMRAGVTTVMVAPSANNLISGAAVVLKTVSPANQNRILRDDGPLMLALGSTVWQQDRAPTSRIGSMSMLRQAVAEAAEGRGHERVRHFLDGKLDGVIVCEALEDIRSIASLLKETRARFSIVHTSDLHEISDILGGRAQSLVVGPYGFDTAPRVLSQPGAICAAGVPVVIAGMVPTSPDDAARISAALAVRYGMKPSDARLALTTHAARLAGVSDRVGALRPGLDADIVVFSDDPLRLDSRILEVYVGGVRVYRNVANDTTERMEAP